MSNKVELSEIIAYAKEVCIKAGKKAEELSESARIKINIIDLKSDVEILYKKLGKQVYSTATGESGDVDEVGKIISEIREKLDEIDKLKQKVNEKKAKKQSGCDCGCCNKDDDDDESDFEVYESYSDAVTEKAPDNDTNTANSASDEL